jgi:hypothetical protein
MDDCKGDWNSTITFSRKNGVNIPTGQQKPETDGVVHINGHGASTVFTGEHRPPQAGPPNALFSTECNPLSGGTFHIKFLRMDKSSGHVEIYRFEGTGTVTNPATGEAKITGNMKSTGGPPDPGDTGTWESTRTGAGGGGGDEIGKDEKKDKDKDKDDRGQYAK